LGDEIPIGSKIIVLCDAVDAMLSDRPYRAALPLHAVLEQLELHAGRQFDHRVVRAATRTAILANYADDIQQARVDSGRTRVAEATPPKLAVVRGGPAAESPAAYH
jgi:HD-GYP domain-containing protein (c-di-GMP phosphodiesterase class II)